MAATFAQPGSSQPTFVPSGTAAVPPQVPAVAAPGNAVMYYPQGAGGVGAVIMPMIAEPPKYEYTPNDFMYLSVVTAFLCGIFSPLTLAISIPAVFFSHQSKRSAENGAVKVARRQGMIAAYLSVAAIISALVVACIATGLVLGLYGNTYRRLISCAGYNYNEDYPYNYSYSYPSYCRY